MPKTLTEHTTIENLEDLEGLLKLIYFLRLTAQTLLFTVNLSFKIKLKTTAMKNIFAHIIYGFSKLSGKLNPSSGEKLEPNTYIQNNILFKQLNRQKIQIINLDC